MGVSHGKCLVHVDGDVDMMCFAVLTQPRAPWAADDPPWTRRTLMYPLRSVHTWGLNIYLHSTFSP